MIFYVFGKFTRKTVTNLSSKVTTNKTITNLVEAIISISITGIGVFIALSLLQLDGAVTSLLAGAGIIGFAFQDIASNFISGVILSIRLPFGIGDIIEINDFYGTGK